MLKKHTLKGFTLLETLIAISILAVILTFVYLSFFTAFRAKSYVEQRNEVYQVGNQIMFHLKRELSSAFLDITPGGVVAPYTYFVGIKNEWNGNPMDKLFFTTLAHVDIPVGEGINGSDYSAIGYDPVVNQDNSTVSLVRRETPFFTSDPLLQGTGYVLTRSIVSLAIYYFDPNTKQWFDEWDTRLQGYNYLPYAVLIQLVLKDHNGVDVEFRQIVRLRMAGQ
ncbi:MAG: PulJ/GspJ family protein [bacterium]